MSMRMENKWYISVYCPTFCSSYVLNNICFIRFKTAANDRPVLWQGGKNTSLFYGGGETSILFNPPALLLLSQFKALLNCIKKNATRNTTAI